MPNYPKNPVSNLPMGQKIPSSWQNRRTPFDENPVMETRFALQDNTDATEISDELDVQNQIVDIGPNNASE